MHEQQENAADMLKLQTSTQNLLQCQKDKGLDSCFTCPSLLECQVRKAYVLSVYQSLSNGQQADFDF